MSVESVDEIWSGRRGVILEGGQREYVRAFRVITDSRLTESADVLVATGVPRRYDVYANVLGVVDLEAYCHRIEATQEDDPYVWQVVCQYSTKVQEEDKAEANPLLRKAEIEWNTIKVTKPLERANDGTAVRNSAGDAFDPPPEIEECRLGLKIARNEIRFDPTLQVVYVGAVNDDAWFGFLPGEVRCVDISAKSEFEKNILFWKVSYTFEIRLTRPVRDNTAWAFKLLDQGYHEIVSNERRLIRDKFGSPVTAPALLDGAGAKLAIGGTPVFQTVYAYPNLSFAALQLP